MRKISIALRRLATREFPSLTRAELRAVQRDLLTEVDEFSDTSAGRDSERDEVTDISADPAPGKDELSEALVGQESDNGELCDTPASQLSEAAENRSPDDPEVDRDGGRPQEPKWSAVSNDETNPADVADSRLDVPDSVPSGKASDRMILIPHDVQADEGFSATFQLSSLPESKVSAQLKVYSHGTGLERSTENASADGVFSVGLPGNGSIRVSPDASGDLNDNRILLALDSAAEELVEHDHPKEDGYDFMPNILDDEPARRLATPIEVRSSFRTTLVCGNPTKSPVMVRLYLIDDNGKKLASLCDPRLNPLPAKRQIALGAEKIFETLRDRESFRGSIVSEVVGEGLVQSVGLDSTESGSSLFRRALNMNIDLEELKTDIAHELGVLVKREEHLKEQMLHLEAVLRFVGVKQSVDSGSNELNLGSNLQGQRVTSQAHALGA